MSGERTMLVLASLGAVTAVAAGCGSSTTTVTQTVGQAGAGTVYSSTTPSGGTAVGKLGDTQSVTINGVDLEATVSDLENPAKTDTPPSAIGKQGQYWVRVTATLTNKGSKPLDSFDAGFQLIDSKGQSTYGNDVTAVGPAPQLSGTLLPGDKLSGAVVFLVPNDTQPEEVRLSSLGGGGVPARWSLK